MINEVLDNFDFFSGLTQRTLSAFHISGINDTLTIDINNIKQYLNGPKYKVIKTVFPVGDKYERIFTDSTSDIVSFSDLTKPVLIEDVEIEMISLALATTYNPITHIKYGKDIILAHKRKPEQPNEHLFFIDMLDCIDCSSNQL